MAGYRRFVAYVYEYRKGKKGGNCGFIKVEVREQRCVMEVHLHCPGLTPQAECRIYGFVRKDGLMEGILLGSCETGEDTAECLIETDSLNMGGSGISLGRMGGIILTTDAGGFFGTEWDDIPVRPDNFREIPVHDREKAAFGTDEGKQGKKQRMDVKEEALEKADKGKENGEPEMHAEMPERRPMGPGYGAEYRGPAKPGEDIESGRDAEPGERPEAGGRMGMERSAEPGERPEAGERMDTKRSAEPGERPEAGERMGTERSAEPGECPEVWKRMGTKKSAEPGEDPNPEENMEPESWLSSMKGIEPENPPEPGESLSSEESPRPGSGEEDRRAAQPEKSVSPGSTPEPEGSPASEGNLASEGSPEPEGSPKPEGSLAPEESPEPEKHEDFHTPANQEEEAAADRRAAPESEPEATSRGFAAQEPEDKYMKMQAAMEAARVLQCGPQPRPPRVRAQNQSRRQNGESPVTGTGQQAPGRINRDAAGKKAARAPFGEPFEPFADGEILHCRKISPKDFARFPRRECALRNNRFLLYGYYNFGHLLLGRKQNGQCILGIPGGYDQQERFMANMFGFPYFKESPFIELPKGRGGYWYRLINAPDLD